MLEAEEIGGERVLKYRFVVTDKPPTRRDINGRIAPPVPRACIAHRWLTGPECRPPRMDCTCWLAALDTGQDRMTMVNTPHDALRYLTALPVYNEASHVDAVLDEVVEHAGDVLVVDDGSNDGTAERLAARDDIFVVRHPQNRGYGAALKTAFDYTLRFQYDALVTIDCDGQHEPQRIGMLVDACRDADIVSGSRYLAASGAVSQAPAERRQINQTDHPRS